MTRKGIECPTCGVPLEYERVADIPDFPFCGRRCRLIDLDRWVEGDHRISRDITEADILNVEVCNSFNEGEKS
ncbi:MAG: DNA gyrase inhibitor YacG [Planctomycetota bacterium]|jgi:endogenous inhibitor of DNA gyrase (YacG/DUF329 family)